jgi:hypothetical protein
MLGWLRARVDRAMDDAAARSARATIEGLNRDGRAFLLALAAQQEGDLAIYHGLHSVMDDGTAPDVVARACASLTATQATYVRSAQRHAAASGSRRGDLLDQLYRGNSLMATLWIATIRARDLPSMADDVRMAWRMLGEAVGRVDVAIDLLAAVDGLAVLRVFGNLIVTDWLLRDPDEWRTACATLAEYPPYS